MTNDPLSDAAFLTDLGRRLTQHRLNQNMTQAMLAAEAGVSLQTVQRIEYGNSTQTSNLVRVLRALGLLNNFDGLVPEPPTSPLAQAKLQGKKRRRASTTRGQIAEPAWTWGDDE